MTPTVRAGGSPFNQPVSSHYWVVEVLHLLFRPVGNTDPWWGKSMRQTFWSAYKGAAGDLRRIKWDFWRIGLVNERRLVGSCAGLSLRWGDGFMHRAWTNAHTYLRLACPCDEAEPAVSGGSLHLTGLLSQSKTRWDISAPTSKQAYTSVRYHSPRPTGELLLLFLEIIAPFIFSTDNA